jgi:dethiobiotin synthetase
MIRLAVTGTDTGVGKTVVSCALVGAIRSGGARVAAMKPVESGGRADAECLWRATEMSYPMNLVCPVSLAEPLAPLVAARRMDMNIDVRSLDMAFQELCATSDAVVVEGAGGLLVPITESECFATLFQRWDMDLVIVSPNRLGAINHTLLTVHAALGYGLRVRAVVLNALSAQPREVAELTNLALLQELLPAVTVVPFAFTGSPGVPPHIPLASIGFDNVV